MLSNTCKYAIRALVFLALQQQGDEKIGIKRIAEELRIPAPFLGKIMQQLAKNKILNSTKGPHGGFALAKEPEDISLYDIVSVIDGTDVFDQCLFGLKICENDPAKKALCPLHKESEPVRKQLVELYKTHSIGEVAEHLEDYKDVIHI